MWEGKRRKNSIDSRLWKRDSRRGRVLELKLSIHAGGDFIGSLTAIDRGVRRCLPFFHSGLYRLVFWEDLLMILGKLWKSLAAQMNKIANFLDG